VAALQWWRTTVVVGGGAPPVSLTVRGLQYDLLVSRFELEALLPQLEEHGVEALFMDRPVPDTLTLQGLEPAAFWRALRANGCRAHFDLPHKNEVAVLAATSREELDSWLHAGLAAWVQKPSGA